MKNKTLALCALCSILVLAACQAATVFALLSVGATIGEKLANDTSPQPAIVTQIETSLAGGFACAATEASTADIKAVKATKSVACFGDAVALIPGLPPSLNNGLIKEYVDAALTLIAAFEQQVPATVPPASSGVSFGAAVAKPDVVAPADVAKLQALAARSALVKARIAAR